MPNLDSVDEMARQGGTIDTKRREKRSHFVIEDLGLARGSRGDEVLFKNVEDVLADLGELGLNFFPVCFDHGDLGFIALALLLLLDGRHDAPACAARSNHVLIRDR